MLEIDMCGGSGDFKFITDSTNRELTYFEEALVDEYCINDWTEGECGYGCSDHASWHDNGYRRRSTRAAPWGSLHEGRSTEGRSTRAAPRGGSQIFFILTCAQY